MRLFSEFKLGIICAASLALSFTSLHAQAPKPGAFTWDGILRSDDHGKTWVPEIKSPLIFEQMTQDTKGTYYALATKDNEEAPTVYETSSIAKGWTPSPIPPKLLNGERPMSVLPMANGSAFLLLEHRLLQSRDGGKNWTLVSASLPADFNEILAGPDQSMIAVSQTEVYRSDNDGKTWQSLHFNFNPIDSAVLINNDSMMVLLSCNTNLYSFASKKLTPFHAPGSDCPENTNNFASPEPNVLLISTYHTIVRSDDNEKTWHVVLPIPKGSSCVRLQSGKDGVVIATVISDKSRISLYRSTDSGKTWEKIQMLPAGHSVSTFLFAADGKIYAAVNQARGDE